MDMDIDDLLHPISAEAPAGPDLRTVDEKAGIGWTYYRLDSLRKQKKHKERTEADSPAASRPNWMDEFGTDVLRALRDRSKDLELAVWVVECWVRAYGFEGLFSGLALINRLLEKFWPTIHPSSRGDSPSARLDPLKNLDSQIANAILWAPFGTADHFNYFAYRDRGKFDGKPQEIQDLQREQGWVSAGEAATIIEESGKEYYSGLAKVLVATQDEIGKLNDWLGERRKEEGPASEIRVLDELAERIDDLVREVGSILAGLKTEDDVTIDGTGPPPSGGPDTTTRDPGGRTQALSDLARIAAFFRRTEPHSPLSYALEQVVRWGKLSLPDLYGELLPEGNDRKQLFRLVGIAEKKSKEE